MLALSDLHALPPEDQLGYAVTLYEDLYREDDPRPLDEFDELPEPLEPEDDEPSDDRGEHLPYEPGWIELGYRSPYEQYDDD